MFTADKFFKDFINDPFFNSSRKNKFITNNDNEYTQSRDNMLSIAQRNPDFTDGILSNWYKNFENDDFFKGNHIQSSFNVDEKPDKYIVTILGDTKNKEFKVDYLKHENQLTITTKTETQEKDDDNKIESSYTSSAVNSVSFDKPVKFDEISGDTKKDALIIEIPKATVDEENVVRIPIESGTKETSVKDTKL